MGNFPNWEKSNFLHVLSYAIILELNLKRNTQTGKIIPTVFFESLQPAKKNLWSSFRMFRNFCKTFFSDDRKKKLFEIVFETPLKRSFYEVFPIWAFAYLLADGDFRGWQAKSFKQFYDSRLERRSCCCRQQKTVNEAEVQREFAKFLSGFAFQIGWKWYRRETYTNMRVARVQKWK